MKILNLKNIVLVSILTLSFVGCTDSMDTLPAGGLVTPEQKENAQIDDPTLIYNEVYNLYSKLSEYRVTSDFTANRADYDFGYPGIAMALDHSAIDMVADNSGYNWFTDWMEYSRNNTNTVNYFPWIFFYSHIKEANQLIGSITEDLMEQDELLIPIKGQAYASRAFDYFHLIQMYQFTYKGHENAPGVPIVKESTTKEEMQNNPRASVQEVYDLILSDLTAAINLLEGFDREGKDMINQSVAYGLRARVYLVMNEWQKAADDADKALDGFTPYSLAQVSKPAFNNANNNNSWMWGVLITPNHDVVKSGIINYPSHLCSLSGGGYASATATYRTIYVNLWNKIPASDIRKDWWVDTSLKSKLLTNIGFSQASAYGYEPYTNVKFGPYLDQVMNSTKAQDYPLMRAEEMILIKAEALAMSPSAGVSVAKPILEDFVKTYRDPSYICSASTPAEMQDEVWYQRRVELWGEGFSFFDIMRLKKPLKRFENGVSNFPTAFIYEIAAESQIFLFRIPESETSVNKGISESDNNPIAAKPSPVIPY